MEFYRGLCRLLGCGAMAMSRRAAGLETAYEFWGSAVNKIQMAGKHQMVIAHADQTAVLLFRTDVPRSGAPSRNTPIYR